jgi:2-hydroxyacyl-CoA lyase 1
MAQVKDAPPETKEVTPKTKLSGSQVIARSLKEQGVEYIFGIVGIPVMDIATAAQEVGIRYIGCRNEQAASYAAGAVGYMTGRPGACLAVSGPGMIHAIAGLANAWSNSWPMILLGGANDSYQNGMGAFQETPQLEAARPFVKYAARPDSIKRLPYYIEQAVRTSIYGRPGAVYLDLPGDIIFDSIAEGDVECPGRCAEPPKSLADPEAITTALEALKSAKRPLVIVGKGAAYGRAEDEVLSFLETTQLPFLPTPMGKGVVPDDHELSIAPARSLALGEADVILLIGARLNWILHFGMPPRFNKDVRILQIDIEPEEISTNVVTEAAMVGDAKSVVAQLNRELASSPWAFSADNDWRAALKKKCDDNIASTEAMMDDDSAPMGYYHPLRVVRDLVPRDAIIVSEGANTMDIGRTVLPNFLPRSRLDAGTYGTMGVGMGFALAAALVHPDRKVVALEGDAAFGFSGMEVETAVRHQLPITFIIINNNGIGSGVNELDHEAGLPAGVYTVDARYEKVMEAFGGKGYFVTKPEELEPALKSALADSGPTIVNIMIDPKATRRPQKFQWLTR